VLRCGSLFLEKRQNRFVAPVLQFFDRDEMEGGRVNNVTLSRGRFRIDKDIAKVSVASLGVHLCTLHVVRSIQALCEQIFRDRFAECGLADASVEFVERSKQRFAGNDVDVDASLLIVPELILESPLAATLAHDGIFLGLQSLFQDGIGGDRTVRIESCGLLFLFLREKEEVEPTGDEHDRDADASVRADHRPFFASDSAPVHQIEINVIESKVRRIRQDGTRLAAVIDTGGGCCGTPVRHNSLARETRATTVD
jgi:hypothetical protein